jgi:hypothetical protein
MKALYLKDSEKNNLCKIVVYSTMPDCSSSIYIENYSKFLLNNQDKKDEIIKDFELISEISRLIFEDSNQVSYDYFFIYAYVKEFLTDIAKKYNFYYVED